MTLQLKSLLITAAFLLAFAGILFLCFLFPFAMGIFLTASSIIAFAVSTYNLVNIYLKSSN